MRSSRRRVLIGMGSTLATPWVAGPSFGQAPERAFSNIIHVASFANSTFISRDLLLSAKHLFVAVMVALPGGQ